MDAVRTQMRNPIVIGTVTFVLGVLIGLVVLGWGLWPIQWTDAAPKDLVYSAKLDYGRAAVEAYAATHDAVAARARYEALGADGQKVLADIANDPKSLNNDVMNAFIAIALNPGAAALQPAGQATSVPPTRVGAGGTPAAEKTGANQSGSLLSSLITLCGIVVLIAALGGGGYFIWRRVSQGGRTAAQPRSQTYSPVQTPAAASIGSARGDIPAGAATQLPPLHRWSDTYKLGDELFDDSTSIELPTGEFVGECGVSISEAIGVGEPKKVTAFEVWLFDKNDYRTVTHVLASEHVLNTPELRDKLAPRGDLIPARQGGVTVLETQTLRMVATITEMGYGAGAMPQNSYFDRFVIELAIWQKEQAG
jgi:hypothetical protein